MTELADMKRIAAIAPPPGSRISAMIRYYRRDYLVSNVVDWVHQSDVRLAGPVKFAPFAPRCEAVPIVQVSTCED